MVSFFTVQNSSRDAGASERAYNISGYIFMSDIAKAQLEGKIDNGK